MLPDVGVGALLQEVEEMPVALGWNPIFEWLGVLLSELVVGCNPELVIKQLPTVDGEAGWQKLVLRRYLGGNINIGGNVE
jgi:hypothetical protein